MLTNSLDVTMELDESTVAFLEANYEGVREILENEKFCELKNMIRHNFTNTYDHSIRVAAGAAKLAKLMGADVESAVKVGLLHDMCFVDKDERADHPGCYLFYHPIEAADNADSEFGLSEKEKKAIRVHMFPLAMRFPTSRIALALTLSDKAVALYEGLYGVRRLPDRMQLLYALRLRLAR